MAVLIIDLVRHSDTVLLIIINVDLECVINIKFLYNLISKGLNYQTKYRIFVCQSLNN